MKTIIIESHYFPNLSYFKEIVAADRVIIQSDDLFSKQTYRNRCQILGSNKVMNLVVPVNHKSGRSMDKLEISNAEDWYNDHKKSIVSAYARSPYFEYYSDIILENFHGRNGRLLELNTAILSSVIDVLGLDVKIEIKSKREIKALEKNDITLLLNKIHPKKPEIKHQTDTYQQVFGNVFQPNLSIIDAIFCAGPQTLSLLES